MANIQIKDLTAASSAADTDQFAIDNASNQTRKVTLSQIFSAFLASARTFLSDLTVNGTFTIQKTAQAGTAEDPILRIGISDAMDTTKGKVEIANASATDAVFTPWLRLYSNATNPNHFYNYIVTDTGTQAALNFDARTNANGTISTRPLFSWQNAGGRRMTLWDNGLKIGSDTASAPGAYLEVQGANSQIAWGAAADSGFLYADGSGASIAYGVKAAPSWQARKTTGGRIEINSSGEARFYRFTGATVGNAPSWSEVWQANGTGFGVGGTPTHKFTVYGTNQQISFGTAADQGMMMATSTSLNLGHGVTYNGNYVAEVTNPAIAYVGANSFRVYADTGRTVDATYTPTERFRVDEQKVDCLVPVRLPSYTPGTLPSVATFARCIVQCASTARGDRLVRSNGTNWVYCEDESTTVSA